MTKPKQSEFGREQSRPIWSPQDPMEQIAIKEAEAKEDAGLVKTDSTGLHLTRGPLGFLFVKAAAWVKVASGKIPLPSKAKRKFQAPMAPGTRPLWPKEKE